MKKKICLIIPSLGGGGAERVALHLLNNLLIEEYEVRVILTKEKGDYFNFLKKKINVEILNEKRVRYSLLKIYKSLKQNKPDILLIFSTELAILIAIFIKPFFKNIVIISRELNIQSIYIKSKIKIFLLKKAYKKIDKLISQSSDMTKDLIENLNISKDKIIEINNPVDCEYIEEQLLIDNKIEFKKNFKNIICVGRLAHQKNFVRAVEIMELLKDYNIRLYILGEGEERQKLELLIKKLDLENKVFLLGRKKNPYFYMKKADLFILSSIVEGFPNALLEAGYCGLYSICNNCLGGISEIIEENVNGNVIDFNNKELVKSKILEKIYIKHDSERIKKSIVDRYSKEIIIRKYQKFLKDIR